MSNPLLKVSELVVHYETEAEVVEAVNGISFELKQGETLGLVGETGAGKTTTALALLKLIQSPPGRILSGSIEFNGEDIIAASESRMRKIRGNNISMVFQDPMTALNPVLSIGEQVAEVIRLHQKCSEKDAEIKAQNVLLMTGIMPDRFNDYPHQFSGGMKQRVVIATALACNPKLLIADEPTTALDVTIQAQVLDMIRKLQKELNTAMLLITHDLGVVAETCDKVAVMYAGNIVEYGSLEQIFFNTKHPYTQGLFDSLPNIKEDTDRLKPIKGLMPNPADLPAYCSFYERCKYHRAECMEKEPADIEVEPGHFVRCRLCESSEERMVKGYECSD